jgi:hypothetical protein
MAYKLTTVNNEPGEAISIDTDDIAELPGATNKWYDSQAVIDDVETARLTSPTIQDKHFYTVGALVQKTGDLYWQIISPIQILEVTAFLKSVPTTGNARFQIYNNQQTLLFDLTLNSNDSSVVSTTEAVSLQAGDYVRVDVLSTGAASDLTISFKYRSLFEA